MNITIRPFVSSPRALVTKDTFRVLSSYVAYQDYILLPLIFLASVFVYNRGSVLPKRDPYAYKLFERPQNALGSRVASQASTRNMAEKIEATNADFVIFWGSQSGVAEGFAQRLARELTHRFKKTALVADLSDFDPQTIALIPRTKLAAFIMSTYGEGDPSDNALEFVAWVNGKPDDSLEDLKYAAFGCGNRNYRHYNKVIDDVVAGLESRGATAIMPTGKGDESTRATEEDFLEWKQNFISVLVSQFNLVEYEVGYEPGVEVITESPGIVDQSHNFHIPYVRDIRKHGLSEVVAIPVATQRAIATYEESDRTCVHLELDLAAHRQIKYKAGDHIAIWPINPEEEISSLLQILEPEPRKDTPIRVLPRDGGGEPKVPSPTTPSTLFRHYLEVCAPVPRESVLFLADFAPTEKGKAQLKSLAQTKDTYARFLEHNHITLSRLLKYVTEIDSSVTWAGLPLSFVIDILPAMKPRTYSISSSPAVSPRRVSITVSTSPARLAAKPDITVPGLSSSYLASGLPPGATGEDKDKDRISTTPPWVIYAQVRTSTFRLPISLSLPIVMVAAGTGIAPFRAFLQERAHLASLGREVGPMLLFFGCQGEADFLYRDPIMELQAGPLARSLQVITAFSRGEKKQYVGDQLATRGPEVARLLTKEDGAFYICGAAAMAKSVKDVVKEQVKALEGWSDAEAGDWMQEKKRARRWFEDVWS